MIPLDWTLTQLNQHYNTQLHSTYQRALTDATQLFAKNAHCLPSIIQSLNTFNSLSLNTIKSHIHTILNPHSQLSICTNTTECPTQHQSSSNWSHLSTLKQSQPNLILLLNIPISLKIAIESLLYNSSSLDSLNPQVDTILSIDQILTGLARSIHFKPHSNTLQSLCAQTHSLVTTDLPHALLAYLQAPPSTTNLPTLLRVIAHLRRIQHPTTSIQEYKYTYLFIQSRINHLPTLVIDSNPYPSAQAIFWIDSVRKHLFDTWALTRVVFPLVNVTRFALHVVYLLKVPITKILAAVNDHDLTLITQHICSALGSACLRLGFDLTVPVLRPWIDFELITRFTTRIQASTDMAITRLSSTTLTTTDLPNQPDTLDYKVPNTWWDSCMPTTATTSSFLYYTLMTFASDVNCALALFTCARVPTSQLDGMAHSLISAISLVHNKLADLLVHDCWIWQLAVCPYLKHAFGCVLDSAGVSRNAYHDFLGI